MTPQELNALQQEKAAKMEQIKILKEEVRLLDKRITEAEKTLQQKDHPQLTKLRQDVEKLTAAESPIAHLLGSVLRIIVEHQDASRYARKLRAITPTLLFAKIMGPKDKLKVGDVDIAFAEAGEYLIWPSVLPQGLNDSGDHLLFKVDVRAEKIGAVPVLTRDGSQFSAFSTQNTVVLNTVVDNLKYALAKGEIKLLLGFDNQIVFARQNASDTLFF